ncbi:hypothetical protein [Streptomyces yaizuensis]|uniref:Uncharacterized protein n=1 Tax=Streptomyces yaizuensis TaxID=2989713 RepID=A0ABQ5NSQ8_9ACTN|nr:hypothetical protein [Streptomyces sp. YSPA8]GLF93402.1 hypothetical protein SYYSPA8_03915 [Streptomyces sp. YSPA8]
MNFGTPLTALFPGASGRTVTALAAHRETAGGDALGVERLAREASVAATQLETVLFRLGLLGMLMPRRRGEEVRVVEGHLVWDALTRLTDLRGHLVDEVRRRVAESLDPAPARLALFGKVAEGTAAHPADLLEIVAVAPEHAPGDWPTRLDTLARELSRDLGNLVRVHLVADPDEARHRAGPDAVVIVAPQA